MVSSSDERLDFHCIWEAVSGGQVLSWCSDSTAAGRDVSRCVAQSAEAAGVS